MMKRRTFRRKIGTRKYKKSFFISTEGEVTEKEYFEIFDSINVEVRVKIFEARKGRSSPVKVLGRLDNRLPDNFVTGLDQAWIVIDRDNWTESQIDLVLNSEYHLAISNPCFEVWLLMHFEEPSATFNAKACKNKLTKYLKNYAKHIDKRKITLSSISRAIQCAKTRDSHPEDECPPIGITRVYKLVEEILKAQQSDKE